MTPPPATAATPTVRPRSVPRRPARAPAPRRVSGPAKRKVSAGDPAARARTYTHVRGGAVALPAPGGLAAGLLEALSGISRQRWLDRLIRGRAWIGLLAFALIGIVAMQLWVVKLGVGIGRALEHEGLLQRENATLSIEDAQLSSGERVEQLAATRGMVVAAPGALRFETVHRGLDARLAAAALARGGQVASAAGSTAVAETGSGTAEASASQSESAAASTETPAASATGSTESASGSSAGSTEGSSASSEGSATTSESAAPASEPSTAAATAPTSGEGTASSSTSASTGGSTPTVGGAAPASDAGTVSADGGTPEPSAGG